MPAGNSHFKAKIALFKVFTEICRCHSGSLLKQACKIGVVVIAEGSGDFAHIKVGVHKLPFGIDCHLPPDEIAYACAGHRLNRLVKINA